MPLESAPEPANDEEASCPKCGSEWLRDAVQLADRGHGDMPRPLSLMVHTKPRALLFKGTRYFTVECRICSRCGHIELRARDLSAVTEALRRRASAVRKR